MRAKLENCKNIKILEQMVSIKSGLKAAQINDIGAMAETLAADFSHPMASTGERKENKPASVDPLGMTKLSYGLFVLTAKDGQKDNGCIINTAVQITAQPLRISIAVNKTNLTHDIIVKTGEFNISILAESAPFRIFEQFGFHSGRDTDKFAEAVYGDRADNGIRYVPEHTNCVISAKAFHSYDCGTHTVFMADVTQAIVLSAERSATYQYYFDNIKPKPQPLAEKKKGFVCKICGYVHEGDSLPEDFVCPLCKHGAQDFEPIV
jgi:flavin reductase (DIM6/NTAB) family NADH-FMN oxidoreductase RutF